MKFGISVAFSDASHLGAMAQAAEAAGFERVTVSDHVIQPEKLATPYPYTEDGLPRWPPFTDWPDPWVVIGAMSALTRRIRFFTSVYVLGMRNPFLVAKTVGTAAVMSGDRVELGIGAGWMREEFELLGQTFDGRGQRIDEMIDVLRLIWGGGFVEHHGEHYDFSRLEMSPVPRSPIPIYVGGFSPPALRRAATRGDGWISDLHSTAELAELIPRVLAIRSQGERAEEPFEVLVTCNDAYDLDGYKRVADLGATHLTTMPWLFYGANPEILQEKIDGIARFGDEIIGPMANHSG
ncbi:MAG: TIGR03619 family F420-dependent LLM class oxidoreductase [Myxococcota bacterium]|nr:TIGR03619 family F420-dependent LLM class oxidoreductase [Myxococcota bacterium]